MQEIEAVKDVAENYSLFEVVGMMFVYYLLSRLGILDLIPKKRIRNGKNGKLNIGDNPHVSVQTYREDKEKHEKILFSIRDSVRDMRAWIKSKDPDAEITKVR